MFGTSINSQSNAALNEITDVARESNDFSLVHKEVKSRIDRKQEKQKEYYDKGRKPART